MKITFLGLLAIVAVGVILAVLHQRNQQKPNSGPDHSNDEGQ